MTNQFSRRRFLRRLPAVAAAVALVRPVGARAFPGTALEGTNTRRSEHPERRQTTHPEPRPGIDASNVLTAEELADAPETIPVFNAVREMPHIADGLRCYCGCADYPGYRSLLSCFEGNGMAMYCKACQGQARLAHRRWKEGQSLDQIRRAIDARYAPR